MFLERKKVLVFSAHAADFCSRAGGTIARLADAGARVHIHGLSYGENCESPALWARDPVPSRERIKDIRKEEIQAAAALVGASGDCFDFGDSPLLLDQGRRLQIIDAIRAFQPDLILTHWVDDILHPDHVEATQAVIWGARYCGVPGIETEHPPCAAAELVCYEAQLGTGPVTKFLPEFYVDISATIERKLEALKKLAAQPPLPEQYEILARYRALEAQITANMSACRFAEGFCRIGTEAVH